MTPCASAALETSPLTATAFPPALVIAATTASAPDLLEAKFTTTDAPSAASDLAMAAPMPFDAPVTTATLPVSLPMGVSFLSGLGSNPRVDASIVREIRTIERAAFRRYNRVMRPLFHPSIDEVTV